MYSKFCGYVKAHINVCPTAGWIEDFPDPYAALFVPFSGKAIVPINNTNWAVLNDPKVNDAIDSAAAISEPDAAPGCVRAGGQADRRRRAGDPGGLGQQRRWSKARKVHGVLDGWNDDWNLSFSSPS